MCTRPVGGVAYSRDGGLQKYLIFAILSCVPDRQRTLRELELGRTLFKEGDRRALDTLRFLLPLFCPVILRGSSPRYSLVSHTII